MRIIEASTIGKSPDDSLCEDSIALSDDFAAVIDGATDKTGALYEGRPGGRFASEVLCTAVRELPADASGPMAIEVLTERLREAIAGGPADGPSASIAIYSRARREIWQVGDVSYSAIAPRLRRPTKKAIDTYAAGVRSALTQALLNGGAQVDALRISDPGREAILPLLREQFRLRNKSGPWSYAALDGDRVPFQKVIIAPVPDDAKEVIIYSDGYPRPARSLEQAEETLQRLLEEDPLCIGRLRGTKGWKPMNRSFDDRAYLRLRP